MLRDAISQIGPVGDNDDKNKIETVFVLSSDLERIVESESKGNDQNPETVSSRSVSDFYFKNNPRSRAFARIKLGDMFESMSAAHYNKSWDDFWAEHERARELIDRFSGSEPKTFEAASAQLSVREAEYHLYVHRDSRTALDVARRAVAAYGALYSGNDVELPNFDESVTAVFTLTTSTTLADCV